VHRRAGAGRSDQSGGAAVFVRCWLRGLMVGVYEALTLRLCALLINDLVSMRVELTIVFNYINLHIIFNSSGPAPRDERCASRATPP
jgi:hypothetical protein